jgi:cell division protein ZipA
VDIKDYILIGGGLLITAVIAHGFWIAWCARRKDLRIDIKPDLIPDDVDDMERLRGELPNGGARLVEQPLSDPTQTKLALDPSQIEPLAETADDGYATEPGPTRATRSVTGGATLRIDPILTGATSTPPPAVDNPARGNRTRTSTAAAGRETAHTTPKARRRTARAKVAEVVLPGEQPVAAETSVAADTAKRPRRYANRRMAERAPEKTEGTAAPVEELIVMNVLAAPGEPYTGDALFTVLHDKRLKFGEMNIFHRVEPLTKAVHYSVANVVEPGTFDMAEMEALRSPGLCLFMQLPGPDNPATVFEDMLSVAREVKTQLGGELKDEQRNVMTPQTVEHYRQRIMDFSRRRMSKRA